MTSSDSEDNDANDDDDECFVVQLLPFVSSMLPARVKLTSCLSDYLLRNFTNSRCAHMQYISPIKHRYIKSRSCEAVSTTLYITRRCGTQGL